MYLLGILVLWKYGGWLVGAVVVYLVCRGALPEWRAWRRRVRARKAERRAARDLAYARAEQENRDWLADGIYEGQYPAETMPLTNQMLAAQNYYPKPYPMSPSNPDWGAEDWHLPPDWSGIVRPK